MNHKTTGKNENNDMSKRKRKSGGALSAVTACISTTMVLILLGSVVMTVMTAVNFSRSVRENFTVEVLLDDSISTRDLAALKGELQRQPYAKQVNYISKEQGTREMMADLDGSPDDLLGVSPIPAEYEVFLNADYANADSLARYMPALQKHTGVKEIVYPLELMDRVDATIRNVAAVLLAVAALLAFISFALINNTVRMNIHSRRFTIRTMKLVGARWSFIRRPFMLQALRIALISAVIAGALLWLGIDQLVRMNDNADFVIVTPTVVAATMGAIVAASLLLTLLCTYVSVNRHLRMTDDRLFLR